MLTRKPLILPLLALAIILISIFLRVVFLNIIPSGFNWDEAAYSYNAFTLLNYGTDQYGKTWPIFLESFGDYKPALLSYYLTIFFKVFAANNLVARAAMLPISLAGLFGIFLLIKKYRGLVVALLVTFLVSISPWHIHYSRTVMDPILGFSFFFLGLGLIFQQTNKIKWLGASFLLLAMYLYNAQRILVPITWVLLLLWEFYSQKKSLKIFFSKNIFYFLMFTLQAGLFLMLLFGNASSRANAVLIGREPYYASLSDEMGYRLVASGFGKFYKISTLPIPLLTDISRQYFLHFQADFLFFGRTLSARHSFEMYGLILPIFLPLILLGSLVFFQKKKDKFDILMMIILFVSPAISAITIDVPHSGRTFSMLVPLTYLAVLGILYLYEKLKSKLIWQVSLMFLLPGLILANFTLYFRDLYLFYPEQSSTAWQEPMKRLYLALEKGETLEPKIRYIETKEDPLIFMAWYGLLDPKLVDQWRGNANFVIGDHRYSVGHFSDEQRACIFLEPKSLYVNDYDRNSPGRMKAFWKLKTVNEFSRFRDTDPVYEFYETGIDNPALQLLCEQWQAKLAN